MQRDVASEMHLPGGDALGLGALHDHGVVCEQGHLVAPSGQSGQEVGEGDLGAAPLGGAVVGDDAHGCLGVGSVQELHRVDPPAEGRVGGSSS